MTSDEHDNIPEYGRVAFPPRVRNALFVEQRGRCFYCGRRMSNHQLEIDHKWPVSRNGGNEFSNLQLLCTACNMRKGIQTDEEFRHRYWRLLPPDGSIPDPPIRQELFTHETQYTRASPTVRGIYRDRFETVRRRKWEESRAPAGCSTLPILLLILVLSAVLRYGG